VGVAPTEARCKGANHLPPISLETEDRMTDKLPWTLVKKNLVIREQVTQLGIQKLEAFMKAVDAGDDPVAAAYKEKLKLKFFPDTKLWQLTLSAFDQATFTVNENDREVSMLQASKA